MVTLTKEDFIAQRKHCFCIAAFLLTCDTILWRHMHMSQVTCEKCYFQCKNQSLPHLLPFDLVPNKYLSWQIKLPLHSFALLYSVELSARGSFVCTSDVTNTARSPQSLLQCENWHYTCIALGLQNIHVGWGVEGSRLEAWMKSHKSEVAVT